MEDSEGIRESRYLHTGQPRDLLHIAEKRERRDEEEDDIELSLGLSLNGRFGVDPDRAKKILRCSSISKLMISEDEGGALARTCSLPAETEDDWRKRKELQSKRRMEAKRKRFEKTKNTGRIVKGKINSEENGQVSGPIGADLNGSGGSIASQGSGGSIASQGSGGSSGVSDPPAQYSGRLPPKVEKKADPSSGGAGAGLKEVGVEAEGLVRGMMVNMPCVTTRGDGPNGKRIEGFLYRYRKGEDVKIVCVCHGSFLSPVEFVKHAGGGDDVAHPLKQIVVCSSTSSFL